MPAPLAFSIAMMALAGSAAAAQPAPPRSVILEEAAADLLSRQFRACFIERDAPLNAESYACLDREYHRLEAVLTREYRAALARQPDDVGREHLQKNERAWWRTLFKHCKDEIGDMRGSTATVMNENCRSTPRRFASPGCSILAGAWRPPSNSRICPTTRRAH
jgi:uncharacterized protein YecT (DUF1311 family)